LLLKRKRIVVINKIDMWKVRRTKEIREFFKKINEEVYFISALNRIGLREVQERLNELVQETHLEGKRSEEPVEITLDRSKELIIERLMNTHTEFIVENLKEELNLQIWIGQGVLMSF